MITPKLNKNFQNAVLYSSERDQSALKNIKGAFRLSSGYPYVNSDRLRFHLPQEITSRFLEITSSLVHAALGYCMYF